MSQAYWYIKLMNGYEPDNIVTINADLIGNKYIPYALAGHLHFQDGDSIVCIGKNSDGSFYWQNDDREGVANSFDEAWKNMPRLVTDPDDYEESEIFEFK